MNETRSNIETVARDICSKQLAHVGISDAELAADVDRYWHCVAAQLESGQIDEVGNRLNKFDLDDEMEAYHDWCRRHPESKPT